MQTRKDVCARRPRVRKRLWAAGSALYCPGYTGGAHFLRWTFGEFRSETREGAARNSRAPSAPFFWDPGKGIHLFPRVKTSGNSQRGGRFCGEGGGQRSPPSRRRACRRPNLARVAPFDSLRHSPSAVNLLEVNTDAPVSRVSLENIVAGTMVARMGGIRPSLPDKSNLIARSAARADAPVNGGAAPFPS